MIDPLKKIEEKISMLEEKISMLHADRSERLARVEALLMKHFDDTEAASSHSDVKEMRKKALTMEAALSVKANSVKAKSSISE